MTLTANSRHASARFCLHMLALAALFLAGPRTAIAVPVNGSYVEDPLRCDVQANQNIGHEIGETTAFPIDERIAVYVSAVNTYRCVADDGAPNDFSVRITNLSPYAYTDLFFVADSGILIGNADGSVEDVLGAPGSLADAFRIDGTTTTTGINDNLFSESGIVNEIFEPGEIWSFFVTNVLFPANVPPTLVFDSAGGFAGSSTGLPSTASILGTRVVPEPSVALLLGLGLAALSQRRRPGA